MKKLTAFLVILTLLCCGLSAPAETGCADVAMEGRTYRLTLKSAEITDGQLTVVIEGFGDTLRDEIWMDPYNEDGHEALVGKGCARDEHPHF